MPVQRITIFTMADDAHIPGMLEEFEKMAKNNKKDGKPYILDVKARKAYPDERSKGQGLIGLLKFESLDDMKYFDEECEAHKQLKMFGRGKIQPPPTVIYWED